mgnify:CR=1 FL=1
MTSIAPSIVGADSISARGRYSLPHTATGAYRMRPYGLKPDNIQKPQMRFCTCGLFFYHKLYVRIGTL